MQLVSIRRSDDTPALCVIDGDELVDLTAAGYPSSLDVLLAEGVDIYKTATDVLQRSTVRYPLDDSIRYLPPVGYPAKAIAVGLNYAEHAAEGNKAPPEYPVLFTRYPSSWVGHEQDLERPRASTRFDYEGELVVVIGTKGRNISKAAALEHVAGYSIFNDGSIRDYQTRTSQWIMGKNFDASGSFGPCFVPSQCLPAGAKGLRLQTRLNGVTVQDANTDDMIFDVATLVATCSEAMALAPGDIIISGTPSGVGFARKPPLFMKAGDRCEVEIEGIGVLANGVVDQPLTC